MFRRTGIWLLCLSLTALSAAPTWAAGGLKLHDIEEQIIQDTNKERKQRGLAPLAIDPKLMKSARRHATWMTNQRSLQHTNAPVGENIAMGQRSSRQAVGDWMHSPGHRANILSHGYSRIGVAAFQSKDGRIYWCQQFQR